MINTIIPIVFVCITSTKICVEESAIDKLILEPVSTPTQCIIAGTVKQIEYVNQHPNVDIEFRVRCVNPNRQKV